jgi:hypothetical protein
MGITQHRVRDGRFVEEWTEYGEFNLMKQLSPPIRSDETQVPDSPEDPQS